ncbi:hypothetical protein ACN94_18870 [Gordonia paraffinivorans]|nr:hypothetical protein [Gordonia paraffinivorans]
MPAGPARRAAELLQAAGAGAVLADVHDRAVTVLEQSVVGPRELQATVRDLRARLAASVDQVFGDDDSARQQQVGQVVLRAAARETPMLRAAYLGHGFEGASSAVPPLADQLGRR